METSESQTDFITRALLARDEAKATGEYYSEEEVRRELDNLLAGADQSDFDLIRRNAAAGIEPEEDEDSPDATALMRANAVLFPTK
jgi:hypothetical protein